MRLLDYNKLITHYVDNYSSKVFMTRLTEKSRNFYVMYIYDVDKELENFSETFLKYLPFYVRNNDYFVALDDVEDIDELLVSRSKSLRRNSRIIPQRKIDSDGIYGELFLDFYLRIVNNRNAILTFANKRSFNSNYETTGPDNIVYYIDSHSKINICICEAKFVVGASGAKSALVEDITGTPEIPATPTRSKIPEKPGHITEAYLNDYFQFIVEKGVNVSEEDKKIFKPFLSDLNKELDNGNDFLSVIIKHDICANFIFFAIFDSTKKEPEKLIQYYNEIYDTCKDYVEKLGLTNYKIEIVFIPTTNNTMTIKEAMEKAYE